MTWVTLPNFITIFRLCLIPFYLYFFIQGQYRLAMIIFALAGISDVVDGGLARYFKQKTRFGSIMDPAADKILMLSTYLTLGFTGFIPMWVSCLVILRDLWIVLGIFYLKAKTKVFNFSATRLSKLNTFFQLFTALGFFLKAFQGQERIAWLQPIEPWFYPGLQWVMWIMVLTTVLSGLQYTQKGLKILTI